MIYLKVVLTSLGSIIVLFLLTKLVGNKQISEFNMFDYIISITIGSIASEMAITGDKEFIKPLIAMVIYAVVAELISLIAIKSLKARRIITGSSITLIDNDEIYMKNLLRAKIDLNELLTMLRTQGYFNIADVHIAYLEPSGQISVLPKDYARPVTPKDMKLKTEATNVSTILVLDGEYLDKNINEIKFDKSRIEKEAKAKGAKSIKDVALASADSNNVLSIYLKTEKAPQNDNFQ